MKKIFRVFIVLILFILIIVVSCTAMMNKEMEKAKNELMLVEDPDLSKVEDGIYRGKVETMLVKAEVEVSVKNHKIISISIIKHENGKGKPAEAIVDAIVKDNSTDVELIAGATMSSLVIRAAVIDAVNKGIKAS
ncbi:MAG: FMN-binding protein [Spirochaetales bacterium]|nr:FMN-binding protein [Spirochaetales bacterium]MDD6840401.1 FMN-binding protein [Spirochaetales bacterium]